MEPEELFGQIGAALVDGSALSDGELDAFGRLDAEEPVYLEAGRLMGKIRDGRNPPLNWEIVEPLAPIATRQWPLDHPARQFAAHMACQAALHRLAGEHSLHSLKADEFPPQAELLAELIDGVEVTLPAAAVYEVWRGKVDSLDDRDAAARRFRVAHRESPDFVDKMLAEPGPQVYFSEAELATNPGLSVSSEREREELGEQLRNRPAAFPAPDLYLTFSLDLGFLRAYGPYWFGLAPHLLKQGLGLIFLVVGDEPETARAIDEAREMIGAAATFSGLSAPTAASESVIFVSTQVPDGTRRPTTYFACARHAHAEALLEETGAPLLIIDCDAILWEDPRPLLDSVAEADIACSRTIGLRSLKPWSRHAAGLVYLAPTAGGRAAARRIREYIEKGLAVERSWTLDQNALAYVLERPDGCRVTYMKLKDMMTLALQPDKRLVKTVREIF